MRPIQLQMSGLQSYRELQTIDFSQLIDAGVFGIFGPTGSGKSSILDAITLALYGKVERASGGTQAIMNHAEQTLFVSFTFELTNAAGTERYRVERQFKRGSEQSINGTIARLLQFKGEETVVLADKSGEVNQQVQTVLGLSMQDFTRAVVLPQGKFAEFLTLTGKDRRQMLQRLFHLEQYGDHLSAKVSSKVKETDSAVKQLAAEQQGLGDASETALEEAKARLIETEQESERSRLELQRHEALHEEHKQVFQWQTEKAALELQVRQQKEQEAYILEKELLLQKAEQAERVRPYLEQQALAVTEVQRSQTQLEAATISQKAADITYEQSETANEQSQRDLAAQEGPLMLRLDQLQQALVLQNELEQIRLQVQEAQTQEAAAKALLDGFQAEIGKTVETKQKALVKQAELKEQLKQVEPNITMRHHLQEAQQEKKAIQLLQVQELEARKEKDAKAAALMVSEQNQAEQAAKRQVFHQRLSEWLVQAGQLRNSMFLDNERLVQLISVVQTAQDEHKRIWKQHEREALAAILAEQLIAGEACAVCGSTEHPSPRRALEDGHAFHGTAGSGAASEETLQQIQDLLQLAKEFQFTHSQQIYTAAHAIEQAKALGVTMTGVTDSMPNLQSSELLLGDLRNNVLLGEVAAARELAVPVVHTDELINQAASFVMLETAWESLRESIISNKNQVGELERSLNALQKEHQSLEQQHAQAAAQQQAAASMFAETERKLVANNEKLAEQLSHWHSRFAELSWDDVETQLEQLLSNERAADELRGRIEKSIPFLDGLLVKIEELQRAALEQDKTALQLDERLQGLAQLAADKSRQLAQRAPGAAVPQLIAEASSALERLRQHAQQTKLAHAAAQREQHLAAQRHSAAAEAAAAAGRQLAQAERALHAALADNGFASREAAEAAVLAPEQRQQWAALAAEHREREQALRHGLAQLAAKLQGRVLSAAEWEQTQAQLGAAKARAEAALETRAKAAQAAEELAARHARWSELEVRRIELAALLERLGKLQAVLKANAFVEYLAEEQLIQVSRAASERLGELTRRRYAIEVDSGGGFVIRDDANGGVKRPVSTLSGGETFLTSLALALALSAQIQLKGEYPLEFFFLDEGFGTLDQDLLDMVIGALEKLHMDSLAVGVISHVPELRARLPRKLIVHPAEPSGRGSRITMEEL
ncbi:SbcC/MukB-like Walker B domain-containing protein [Paenibacillus sedimenti]|uniref:Nuclease SbcCD subunit C n=1 Tax=Paenibacillus sedimenti TaxID=2770274 RepID=A0A926KK40_9BACL|nr:SMC family ATPase [Paenibacillus sedimenti]MBD0379095.1 SMC family ATPase [Paenibacillus sedimenti]